MKKKSIFKRLYLAISLLIIFYGLVLVTLLQQNGVANVILVLVTMLFLVVLAGVFQWQLSPLHQSLSALDNGINAFKDNDFSLTIHDKNYVEVSQLLNIYNELSSTLRDERMDIFQRELLLDTVIQSTPVALVLTSARGSVVYSNVAAKELLKQSQKLEGKKFSELIQSLPLELQKASKDKTNGLVSDISDEHSVIYHVNCRKFTLNGSEHTLYLYKNMTNDISRQETKMWKQVIRLISHELNNSLAPISSLTRSAQKIIDQPEHIHMLSEVLETIGIRTKHLHDFISQYAKFARFPKPNIQAVDIVDFFKKIEMIAQVNCQYEVYSESATFDAGQIEQVLINLIKNAKESGSEPQDVSLKVCQQAQLLTFTVSDRGSGLTEQQMQQALLPFFTTKQSGTGIGLALSNDIVNSHGGKLRLVNREKGGLSVSFSLDLAV